MDIEKQLGITWEEYCNRTKALQERGVQVGDILECEEGARPTPHYHTGKLHVRISLDCVIKGPNPRFFIHGFRMGKVAYIVDVSKFNEEHTIPAGTKFKVTKDFGQSCMIEVVEESKL